MLRLGTAGAPFPLVLRMLLPLSLLLLACVEQAGPSPRSQAAGPQHHVFNGSEKELFDEVARSLVGAHESLGRLAPSYDLEGDCGSSRDEGCYVWRFRSSNPTVRVMLTRFEPHSRDGVTGDYEGFVYFVDRASQLRRIDLKLRYSGDELNVRLSTRTLPPQGTNS